MNKVFGISLLRLLNKPKLAINNVIQQKSRPTSKNKLELKKLDEMIHLKMNNDYSELDVFKLSELTYNVVELKYKDHYLNVKYL